MRIDPAQLFTTFAPSEADHQAAHDFLRSHTGVEPTPSMLELTLALLHLPAAWHFEHDGWWIGGFGGFPGLSRWSTNAELADRIFLCKDKVGSVLQSRLFLKTVSSMHAEGLTEPGVFFDRLTQGLTPRQFMDCFGMAHGALGPYQRPLVNQVDEWGRNYASEQAILKPGERFRHRFDSLARIATGNSNIPSQRPLNALDLAGQQRAQSRLMASIDLQSEQTQEALLNTLSQASVEAAASAGFDDLQLVSWLTMGHSERRIQALQAHPGTLGDLVLQYWRPNASNGQSANHLLGTEDSPKETKARQAASGRLTRLGNKGISALTQCIDQGLPWYTEAAYWLTELHAQGGMLVDKQYTQELVRGFQRIPRLPLDRRPTKATLEHLGWLQPQRGKSGCLIFNKPEVSQAAMVIWLTGVLQLADLPLNDAQWAAARETLSPLMMHDALSFCQQAKKGLLATSCLSLNSVRAYRRRFQGVTQPLTHGSTDWLLPFNLLHDLANTTLETATWIAQALGNPDPTQRFFLVMDVHWTVKQWQRAQRVLHGFHEQWTRRHAATKAKAMAAIDQDNPPALWPIGSGLPIQKDVQGVSFKALAHPLALLKEGEHMGHCVAGYSPSCFSGDSRIYSVSDPLSGERATLELAWVEKRTDTASPRGTTPGQPRFLYPSPQLIIQQLRGPHNEGVSERLRQAAEAFVINARSSGALEIWPHVEVPKELQEQNGPDDVFFEQVRRWMVQHYPQLHQHLAAQKN